MLIRKRCCSSFLKTSYTAKHLQCKLCLVEQWCTRSHFGISLSYGYDLTVVSAATDLKTVLFFKKAPHHLNQESGLSRMLACIVSKLLQGISWLASTSSQLL